MANSSVLDPFSTKPRETMKVNPRDQVGGPMEYIEGALDLIFKGPQEPLVNEGPIRSPDKVEAAAFSPEGSVAGFQSPRRLIDTSPEARISSLEAEQFKVWHEQIARAPVEEKRVNINELNGLQVLYEGAVDSKGNVTQYHQAEADRKQSENIALSIQREREEKLAVTQSGSSRKSSKGALSGANDLLLNAGAQEGQSMTSSAGAVRGAG